jgi:hypothetical protein
VTGPTGPTGAAGSDATILLAAVAGTDGTTATPNANYASFGTAWTATVTIGATQDIIIEVEASWHLNTDSLTWWGIFRGGTQVYSSGIGYSGEPAQTYNQSKVFRVVDKAVAAGTYTYEVKVGSFTSLTVTLANAIVATPAASLAGTKGASMLTVSQAANV